MVRTLTFLIFICSSLSMLCVQAADVVLEYRQKQDDFGISTHTLIGVGRDIQFITSCYSGDDTLLFSIGSDDYEDIEYLLDIRGKILSQAKKTARIEKLMWRVDKKNGQAINVDVAIFSDGWVLLASQHIVKFLSDIYGGNRLLVGFGVNKEEFPLTGSRMSIKKIIAGCNWDIDLP